MARLGHGLRTGPMRRVSDTEVELEVTMTWWLRALCRATALAGAVHAILLRRLASVLGGEWSITLDVKPDA